MAESLAGAAEETAEGIGKIAVSYSSTFVSSTLSITISSISARTVAIVTAGLTTVTLGAIYARYKLKAKEMDAAISRGLGGERDDQAIRDIRTGCLHVLLHCFTDRRLLEVLEDFESGRMKERLKKEFSEIGIEVEGLKVEIDNVEEVNKRKEQILSSKKTVAENVDVNVVQKETNEEAKTKERMKERLKKDLLEIGSKVERLKVGVDDIQEVKKCKEQILSSNIQMAENIDVYIVQRQTCEEARTNELEVLDRHVNSCRHSPMASPDSFGGYEEDRFENKVDIKLRCSVCLKVFKDPVQCPNEHYFCHSCIKENLRHNAKTCPVCQHPLTEETLTKPPRILTELLEGLMIRCDYENRGCQELIKLEFLDCHIRSCGYSPTRCINTGCTEVINRHEKERHEHELCEFRKIVCDECGEQVIWKSSRLHPCFMQKQIDELARRLDVVQNDLGEVKHKVKLTQEEMASITKEATERSEWFTGRQKIFVLGGYDGKIRFNSAESYSWPDNFWTLEPTMNEKRSNHSAFVHDREIYVSGGCTGTESIDSIESLNFDEENLEWKPQFKIPIKSNGHKMVCHENNLIQTGGCDGNNVSDGIYEISLNPPHSTKLLTKMPEPRCSHGCEIIDNQVVVAGGRTSRYIKDAKNTVYAYDLNNNELKTLPPLPFAVSQMATVSYKGNIILIGGVNEKVQTLNTVVMYDVKTGKIKMLPCLNYKRAACAAVITGNIIVVMGGLFIETVTYLNSVECLDLNTNVWRELSPMTTKRSRLTAVLKPIS